MRISRPLFKCLILLSALSTVWCGSKGQTATNDSNEHEAYSVVMVPAVGSEVETRNTSRFKYVSNAWNGKVLVVTDAAAGSKVLEYSVSERSWKTVDFGGPSRVSCIAIREAQSGYLVDVDGNFWTTEDQGQLWSKVTLPNDLTLGFQTANGLFLVGESHFYLSNTYFGLLETRDKGRTWSVVKDFNRKTVSTVEFLDGSNGFAFVVAKGIKIGDLAGVRDNVYQTVDGGITWKLLSSIDRLDGIYHSLFKDKSTGYVFGSYGPANVTSNSGKTWAEFSFNVERFVALSIGWVGNSSVLVSGYQFKTDERDFPRNGKSILLRSDDGGSTYSIVFSDSSEPFFSDVKVFDRSEAWLIGRDRIFRTIDGGSSWKLELQLHNN